jgi:hypothetical protein
VLGSQSLRIRSRQEAKKKFLDGASSSRARMIHGRRFFRACNVNDPIGFKQGEAVSAGPVTVCCHCE